MSKLSKLFDKLMAKERGIVIELDTSDEKHLKWLRSLPCAECRAYAPSEAHHPTYGRGMSMKSRDRDAFPLCKKCHHDFHAAKGTFSKWPKEQRRAWQERFSAKYRMMAGGAFSTKDELF